MINESTALLGARRLVRDSRFSHSKLGSLVYAYKIHDLCTTPKGPNAIKVLRRLERNGCGYYKIDDTRYGRRAGTRSQGACYHGARRGRSPMMKRAVTLFRACGDDLADSDYLTALGKTTGTISAKPTAEGIAWHDLRR